MKPLKNRIKKLYPCPAKASSVWVQLDITKLSSREAFQMLVFSCSLKMKTAKQHNVDAKLTNVLEPAGHIDKLDYTIFHSRGDLPTIKISPITETLFELNESVVELLN